MSIIQTTTATLKPVSYNPFSMGELSMAIPTTEAQREMWATIALDRDATLCYNESLAIEIMGDINPGIMELAFQEVLKRHDALRSVFSANGKYFFIKEYRFQALDFRDYSTEFSPEESLEKLKASQVALRFNLKDGPLFIASLIKLADKKFNLIMTGHHIVVDGWSFATILTELTTMYSALIKNVPFSFTPAAQFSDYAIQEATQGLNSTHKKYWLDEFKTPLAMKKIPLDFTRPKFRSYDSQRFDLKVPDELSFKIKKFSASQGLSLYTFLMASFQILLHKISGTQDVVIGMASAAQSASGKSDLVGHLVNLLPLRNTIQPDQSIKLFMKQVRSKMLDAFDHQHFSFGSLLKELNLERNLSEIPLLNIVFNIDQQSADQGLKFDGLKSSYTTIPRTHENFELFINVVSCEHSLIIECQYNKNLFKPTTIQNWFESYLNLIEMIISSADTTLAELPVAGLFIPAALEVVESDHFTPQTADGETLRRIKQVWQNVLALETIDIKDNFFALGGHSLLALELASQLEQEFQTEVTIRDIFEKSTIHKLAVFLDKSRGTKTLRQEKIAPSAPQSSYPVTHNQLQVWYLEEMLPKTLMHNLPSSIRLKFRVDPLILEQSLEFLIRRHDALRTAIVMEDGRPVQKILPPDLSQFRVSLPLMQAQESEISEILNGEANFYFNKENPPLFKARLYQLGPEDFVFFFMVHHSIWDGWCFDIFFDELNIIYSALTQKAVPQFERNPQTTYADYAVWMERNIENDKFSDELKYWQHKLKSPLPVLELPNDFKRPTTASHEGATFNFVFSNEEARNLRAYAKAQGASLFNVLLTAFKLILARYTNLDDVIVGSPVRARNQPELLHTIGYFVNTVALRTSVNVNASFEENLQKVTSTFLEAQDHQTLPFQIVLNQVEHPKDPGRTPIFQTFFSYQDVSNRRSLLNGRKYEQINIDKASTHTDLDLWVKANDSKIEGAFEYRKDLFKEITIQRFCECFLHLVTSLTKDGSLPPLQRDLILNKWNATSVDVTKLKSFHHTFEAQALATPENIAVRSTEGVLTYKELNEAANRVAHGLIYRGVCPGDLVALSLNRQLNLLVAILGILKSGAGYVPLDPAFPQERLDYMLESSTPKTLITEQALAARFNSFESLTLMDDLLNDETKPSTNPTVRSQLSDTMYVIYTSGSTGKPKGVQISQGALANFLTSMGKAPGINSQDKLLAVTTFSFDIAALELYLPLTCGASLYLASSLDVIDGKALKNIIQDHGITMMQATPSSWRLLLAAGWRGGRNFKILCGGEPFPKDLAQNLLSLCDSVWNMYGPTETTVWSTIKKLHSQDEIVSIGTPIDNTYTYILNESRQLAPIGAPGELYIGGLGLADGYFRHPDLTTERFVPNPFVPGEKMYATGDFARYKSNGDIECLGRQDGQVKVRGYRIELGEIEAVMSKLSFLQENAVITKEVKPGDVRIIAFVVMKNDEILNEKKLRHELDSLLPKYMIPSHFFAVSELPRTLNAKIDKKTLGLKVPYLKEAVNLAPPIRAEEDELSEELKKLWSEVLGVSITNKDNFFHVGGNSLLAVKLFSKISRLYQIQLPLSLLLEAENFEAFVRAFKTRQSGNNPLSIIGELSSLVPIKYQGESNPIFCFHGVGGNVLNYTALIPSVGNKRGIIGIQSMGINGKTPMARSFEEMASHYIREMKMIQPQGPYFLAGGSMGGMVALEVARQLQAQGETIEKLVMFDTFGPRINIKSYDKGERNFFQNLKVSIYYRRKVFINGIVKKILGLLGAEIPLELKLFDVEMNNYKLLWNYRPGTFQGDLHLIRAHQRSTGWYSDPEMGWSETISGKIHTFEIQGSHRDFIESPELPQVFAQLI